MSVTDITPDAVLEAVLTAQFPPSTAHLAMHFEVIPASPTLRRVIGELVEADRLVVANPGQDEPTWAAA